MLIDSQYIVIDIAPVIVIAAFLILALVALALYKLHLRTLHARIVTRRLHTLTYFNHGARARIMRRKAGL